MVLNDREGGQPGAEARHPSILEFADSYARWSAWVGLKPLETDVSRLFRFAGEVDAGYVAFGLETGALNCYGVG